MKNDEIKTEIDRYSDSSDISELTNPSCFCEEEKIDEFENPDVIEVTHSPQTLWTKPNEEEITVPMPKQTPTGCCRIS